MSMSQILADTPVAQATPSQNKIAISSDLLADFCRRHHIRKLAFFGSVLRDDFNSASDVDVLVDFEPNYRIGLIKMAGIEIELGRMLGRKVDLRTPADLSRYFRQKVVASAEIQYVRE
jgi:predicted nucleotidyltransferase